MKTVLIDNSLCTFPLAENVNSKYIYIYICELRATGFSVFNETSSITRGRGVCFPFG